MRIRLFDARTLQATNDKGTEIDVLKHAVGGGVGLYLMDRDGSDYGILFAGTRVIGEIVEDLGRQVGSHDWDLVCGRGLSFIEASGSALAYLVRIAKP